MQTSWFNPQSGPFCLEFACSSRLSFTYYDFFQHTIIWLLDILYYALLTCHTMTIIFFDMLYYDFCQHAILWLSFEILYNYYDFFNILHDFIRHTMTHFFQHTILGLSYILHDFETCYAVTFFRHTMLCRDAPIDRLVTGIGWFSRDRPWLATGRSVWHMPIFMPVKCTRAPHD